MENRFANWKHPEVIDGVLTKYNWLAQNVKNLHLGFATDIGAFSYINALHGVTVEDHVQVGSHCSIYSVSTIDGSYGEVLLKRNCKIGSHSTVLPGVSVGENSIVGAHSLVNSNIPDNVVAFGVPAKIVRQLKCNE